MVLIYIRHAKDDTKSAFLNGSVNDAPLYPTSKNSCKKLGKKLIEKYGVPKVIYTSPFLRCKETVKYMLEGNKNLIDKNILIEPDLDISKWFPSDQKDNPQITSKTSKYDINVKESYDEFKNRIKNHYKLKKKLAKSKDVYWCVTHAIVFKKIHNHYYGIEGYDHVYSLQNFVVKGDEV